jgi:hypothetical protein
MSHVYFPVTHIVSLLYVLENGSSAEIAVVGNEGVVGNSLFMGGGVHAKPRSSAKRRGCRPTATAITEEFNRAPVLHLRLRYTQALITQMAQTAVCTATIRSTSNFAGGFSLAWTACRATSYDQELIANMLACAGKASPKGRSNCRRLASSVMPDGRITVLERRALRVAAASATR